MFLTIRVFFLKMFIIPVLSESGIELISAQHIPEYDNKYEETNAVETYHVKFVLECAVQCSSHKCCISFFHNRLTGSCILHSDPFVYTIMTLSEEGWSFYLTRERLGRCPIDFFYCRELDICYQFGPTIQAIDVHNASACPGNDLLRIDSEEKKEAKTQEQDGCTTMVLKWSILIGRDMNLVDYLTSS
ncbi:Hypothetical predicted protein [Mytilus galloprovincialis]|uniref:Apple domain-containing protein n=1 Tax=Mytilus galloprovincialis TaxID=29158 RepID=A0A8B6CT61_MYTGA|nr:Hypothetical predicted protein [Mytilus galloprovincialis]